MKKVYDACVEHNVQFIFGQTGNIFIKDGKEYKIRNRTEQMVQALKSGLNHPPKDIEAEVAAIPLSIPSSTFPRVSTTMSPSCGLFRMASPPVPSRIPSSLTAPAPEPRP